MGANQLQKALAVRKLAEARRMLADSNAETRKPDYTTDVTDIDSNPVTTDEARNPDDTADVTHLEPSAGVKSSRRRQADFPNQDEDPSAPPADPSAPPAASPADPSADPAAAPTSDDQSDASESIADLPITWNQDESGQPYGTVDGTGLDIFVNEDKSWQVLPEGSDQPIDQGQGATYEDAVQQAFQSAQSGGAGAGDPSAAAPVDPAAGGPAAPPAAAPAPPVDPALEDPTKVAKRKSAGSVPGAVEDTATKTDVTKLKDYETMEDGGGTFDKAKFENNAGDGIRKLDDSTAPEMLPGGADFPNGKKASVVRTSAAKASELVDLYMQFGIVKQERTAKYAAIAKVQSESRELVLEKIALLEAVEAGQKRIGSTSAPRNTVPRLAAARVPNMTRSASDSSLSASAASVLFGL